MDEMKKNQIINLEKIKSSYIINKGKGYIKKYYDNGNIRFEGEYLNGKRNGKGKEYYYDGKLKFEGEYLNGKRQTNK